MCVAGGMHGRGHAWWGVCVVRVHGRGACMEGGHVWQRGHAWQGAMRLKQWGKIGKCFNM